MESYRLDALGHTAHLALFRPLSNGAALRQRLVAASQAPATPDGDAERQAVDFAFVDARAVTSRLHVLTAVTQALLAKQQGTMKTKTSHSEVLWALEPGTNITDSLKHFGLSPSTKSLLLVHLAPLSSASEQADAAAQAEENRDVLRRLEEIVEGSPLGSLEELGRLPEGGTDEKGLRKLYKLNGPDAAVFSGLKLGTEEHLEALDRLAVSSVALKTAA